MLLPGAVKPAQRWQSLTCALAQLEIRLWVRPCFFTAQNSGNVSVWKSTFLASSGKPLVGCGMSCCLHGAKTESKPGLALKEVNSTAEQHVFFITFGFPC